MHAFMILCACWRFYSSRIQLHVEKVGTPQKSTLGKPLTCNILYKTKKNGKKKSFGIYYLYLLKLLKMTYGSLSRSGTGQLGIDTYMNTFMEWDFF